MKKCLISLFLLLTCYAAIAQERITVTGTVMDTRGEPLVGASVVEKTFANTTLVGYDGKFTIIVSSPEAVLSFEFIGFKTVEKSASEANNAVIVMEEDMQELTEVVIVGYGSLEKRKITSAITSVKPENFNKGNINNPIQLLQGNVAGLSIVSPQGNPNGTYNVRLRGLSTIGANTEPLIIIDGVIGVAINSVDPNDIVDVQVLKDGGAAAIYGTRGSSGVIIITTKTGIKGKASINYNGYTAVENIDR